MTRSFRYAIASGALCAAALSLWSPTSHAGTIAYTYDPAGRLVAVDHGGGNSTSYAYDNAGNLLQSSTPSPGLVIGPIVNGQFSIAWPSAPGGFILESTSALGPGAVWSPVLASASPFGSRLFVTLSFGPTQIFYRLHK